jgi:RHS repeat-associated protein
MVQRQQWTLDKAGNWLVNMLRRNDEESCQQRVINRANEYTIFDSDQDCPPSGGGTITTRQHDDNGNLISDGTLLYEYDVENRLTRVTRSSDLQIIAEYFYDALDRRVCKIVSNSGSLDGARTFVLDDRWRVLAEYDAGGLAQEYVYGVEIDEPLVLDRNLDGGARATDPGDQRIFYHANTVGSIIGLTDSSGALTEAYEYDAYGEAFVFGPGPNGRIDFGGDDLIASSGISIVDNRYLFAGRRLDAESQKYYCRYRYLDSQDGRFLTRDPIGYRQGVNLYEYVGGAPARATDPMGLAECTPSHVRQRRKEKAEYRKLTRDFEKHAKNKIKDIVKKVVDACNKRYPPPQWREDDIVPLVSDKYSYSRNVQVFLSEEFCLEEFSLQMDKHRADVSKLPGWYVPVIAPYPQGVVGVKVKAKWTWRYRLTVIVYRVCFKKRPPQTATCEFSAYTRPFRTGSRDRRETWRWFEVIGGMTRYEGRSLWLYKHYDKGRGIKRFKKVNK